MKDEIKEILEELKEKNETYKECSENGIMENEYYKSHLLLNYITNLQEEINKLTSESTEWEERTYCWQDRAENLEIIIDKAIELISKEFLCYDNESDEYIQGKKAINILQGSDNNE